MDSRTKSLLKFLLFVVFIAVLGLSAHRSGLGEWIQQDRLRGWVEGFGLSGPLLYIAVFAVAPALFLPALPITVTGGLVFGPLWGTVYASIGSTLGAALSFLISRYFARQFIRDLLGHRFLIFDQGVEQKGWVYVAITRLIPAFPYNLINYAFGLTRIRFFEYLLTSWICMLPATAAFVIFSSSLLDLLKGKIPVEFILGVVLLILAGWIPVYYLRKSGREKTRKNLGDL